MQELYFECLRAEAQDDCVRTLGNDQCASAVKTTLEYLATKMGIKLLDVDSIGDNSFAEYIRNDVALTQKEKEEILEYHGVWW